MSSELMIPQQTGLEWMPAATDEAGLLEELRVCLSLSIENISKAAKIVNRFDELGLSKQRLEQAVPGPILRFLRLIGSGKMLPETFMRLNGKVQDAVSQLPIETQRELCDGKPVELVRSNGEASSVTVERLSPQQVSQVFDRGRIRTAAEQEEYLRRQKASSNRIIESPRDVEKRLAAVRLEKSNGEDRSLGNSTENMIEFYAGKLESLLSTNPHLGTRAMVALTALMRLMPASTRPQDNGVGVVRRIVQYLEITGPMSAASLGKALELPEAEIIETVKSNSNRFVMTNKEIALRGQRI